MTLRKEARAGMPRGVRLVLQLLGFVVGLALVAWCIRGALEGGEAGWEKFKEADPGLIAAMIGCSLASVIANGAIFFATIRPVHREGFMVLQGVNLVSSLLNYAPIRLGVMSRYFYHVRVDRFSILFVTGWIVVVGITVVAVMGAAVGATFLQPQPGMAWALMFLAPLIGLILALPILARLPLVRRFTRGGEAMLTNRGWIATAFSLRAFDLGMWAIRLGIAASILGIDLPTGDVLLLAITALVVSLNPLGRLGWREAAVAILAAQLAAPGLGTSELDATFKQLALLESAAEASITIPLGVVALVWWIRKVRARRSTPSTANADS
ncbi:MAG: hypothetical protein O3A19_07645 [Planctomycetota bacterium]|jgi:hypothetical protein|nr:hypothetical protein [Planctomycetota bacterium]MDA1026285.1 hypothetical protein [Planctomycetota bacterium]